MVAVHFLSFTNCRQKPEEDEEVFRSQLKEFLSNESEEEHAFPASLSGYQRKYIHEVRK